MTTEHAFSGGLQVIIVCLRRWKSSGSCRTVQTSSACI